MSFRVNETNLYETVARLDREVADLKRRLQSIPTTEWRPIQDGTELRMLHVETGAVGPVIGVTE